MASDPGLRELLELARDARGRALCDVSGYAVGAALRASSGAVYTGCNLENIVLAESYCAEKVALVKALEAGERSFEAVAISTISSPPASPCGSCRQMLFHWGVATVASANDQDQATVWRIEALLPEAFHLER